MAYDLPPIELNKLSLGQYLREQASVIALELKKGVEYLNFDFKDQRGVQKWVLRNIDSHIKHDLHLPLEDLTDFAFPVNKIKEIWYFKGLKLMKVPNESDPTLFMEFYATEKIQGLIQVVRENSQGQIEEVLSVSAFEGLHQAFDEIALFYLINGFKPTNAQLDEAEKLLQVVVDPKMAALMV